MKIGITSDHRGFELKTKLIDYLNKKNFEVIDFGPNSTEMVDYTIYAFNLGERVAKKEVDFGIVVCGTGIGISIACNEVKGIRCGKVDSVDEAIHGRERDFVNVIALSGNASIWRRS